MQQRSSRLVDCWLVKKRAAKYKQLGEYAELVPEQANSTASRAPLFAVRLD
jgi:hypothetical protein